MTLKLSPPPRDQQDCGDKLKDSLLARKVTRAIAASGYAWLNHLEIRATQGVVSLTGTVHSLFLREVAQQVAQNVPGVHSVQCQLQIE